MRSNETTDKKKKFKRFNNLTPIDFYKKHINIDLKEKVCLIHFYTTFPANIFDSFFTLQ